MKLLNIETENCPPDLFFNTKKYKELFLPFYHQHGGFSLLLGDNDFPLSGAFFRHPSPRAKVVLLTGYNESYLKYVELIHDLWSMSLSVYCYDHRGQGFSGRFQGQNKRGFVDSFESLVNDCAQVFKYAQQDTNSQLPLLVIAHSMGGAVATKAACDGLINPHALILSAPLLGLAFTSHGFIENCICSLARTAHFLGLGKKFAFGQKDCVPLLPFETNDVTHCAERFQVWREQVSKTDALQLGGVTFGWLNQCLRAVRLLRARGANLSTPTFLLQAQEDTVVSNACQDLFLKTCGSEVRKIVIEGARHEIFMEIDLLRDQSLGIIRNIVFNL